MEWSTITALAGIGIAHVIELGVFIWYLSGRLTTIENSTNSNGREIVKVEATLGETIEKFDMHLVDKTVHTTEEQRRGFDRRMDKIEHTMAQGIRDLGTKIDNLVNAVLKH
jgi:hypothetical protein